MRLCLPAGAPKGSDRPQEGAAPALVAKYSAWPFTCLWPESPPNQPPPLPSQSPSPPAMPPTNSYRPFDAQPAKTDSHRGAHGSDFAAAAALDSHRAADALLQAQVAVAATAHRPSGRQAPKVLRDHAFVSSALEGPHQPASKRQRGALSVSPDDGRGGTHHASSRSCCQLLTVAAPVCLV